MGCSQLMKLHFPVALVFEEILIVPGVEGGLEEPEEDMEMSHVAEAAVGGVYAAGEDTEAPVCNLLAEQIVFGVHGAFVEASELDEALAAEEHEHAGRERTHETRGVLHQ